MSLTFIHDRLASAAVLFTAVCAAWGIIGYLRNQPISSNYWGTLAIAEVLMVLQAIIGVVLWIQGARPDRDIVHLLYGATAVISLPAAYVYTNGKDDRPYNLLYGVVSLWLVGIALRGITTGGG